MVELCQQIKRKGDFGKGKMENRRVYSYLAVAFAFLAVALFLTARSAAAEYEGVYSFYALSATFAVGAGWIFFKLVKNR